MMPARFLGGRFRMTMGFTLVELLVTIAIIAVLAGMLLPAVDAVRAASRSAVCATNLRQLSMGVLGYAAEHDAFLPTSMFTANPPAWAVPTAYYGFAGPFASAAWCDDAMAGSYVEAAETQGGVVGRTSTVRARGTWACPVEASRPFFAAARPYNIDYGLNTRLSPAFDGATWTASLRLGQLPRASTMLLIGETRNCRWSPTEAALPTVTIHDPALEPSWMGAPYPTSLFGRHRGMANFAAADGRVQAVRDLTAAISEHSLLVDRAWGL